MKKHVVTLLVEVEKMSKNEFRESFEGLDAEELDELGYVISLEDGYTYWVDEETFKVVYTEVEFCEICETIIPTEEAFTVQNEKYNINIKVCEDCAMSALYDGDDCCECDCDGCNE